MKVDYQTLALIRSYLDNLDYYDKDDPRRKETKKDIIALVKTL